MLDIPEESKKLFRDEYTQKNIRINFPDGERPGLSKKDIYEDGSSFAFTESICSQENLKFGIAESSVLKFDTIDVENIKGCRIEACCEVTDTATGGIVSIPLGIFTVDSCKRQNDMRRRKVVAYSGTKIEVSPLTMAKLSVPSLTNNSYKIDVDEILGQGGQHLENYTNTTSTDFSDDDSEMVAYSTFFSDLDGNRYKAFFGFSYMCIEVNMTERDIYGGDNPSAWYEITSYPDLTATSWDSGIMRIKECLNELKSIIYYQSDADGQELNKFVKNCETMLEASVELNIQQTSGRKKLKTSKRVAIVMDGGYGRVKKNKYPSYGCLNIANAEGTLKFMCTSSIHALITKIGDEEDTNTEIWSRDNLNCKRNVLYKHARELKRYPQIIIPGQEVTMPTVELPLAEFVREQGADGYYHCVNIAQNISKALDAIAEIQAGFLHIDRFGILRIVGISKHFGLYPSKDLYPAEDLYPEGTDETMTADDSISVWYDDYEVQPYGAVRVNYKNENGNDEVLTYRFDRAYRNVYHFKNNYVFKISRWRPEEIRHILDDYFIPAVRGISYRPIQVEMKGLPYMEAGDVITVLTQSGGVEAYVFRRTMRGINSMRDSIEARGDEVNADESDDSVSSVTIET